MRIKMAPFRRLLPTAYRSFAPNASVQKRARNAHRVPRPASRPGQKEKNQKAMENCRYKTFLFSAPSIVTMTVSGVMISAPFAVAAPWNICSTMALNVATTGPSATCSAVPRI